MLFLYPIFVSQSVSRNIVPGICKALERFLLIRIIERHMSRLRSAKPLPRIQVGESEIIDQIIENELSTILENLENYKTENEKNVRKFPFFTESSGAEEWDKAFRKNSGLGDFIDYADKTGDVIKAVYTEEIDLDKLDPEQRAAAIADLEDGYLPGAGPHGKELRGRRGESESTETKRETKPGLQDPTKSKDIPFTAPTKKEGKSPFDVKIGRDTFNTINLEPTYAEIDDIYGKTIYGVKVVAIPISKNKEKDTFDFFNMDASSQKTFLEKWLRPIGREMIRKIKTLRGRFLKLFHLAPTAISGDPIRDIVYAANTKTVDSIFICLSTSDIKEDLLNRPNLIRQLFKFKWNAFVITSEVKRVAYFCLKAFRGMCSQINYQILMTSFGKDIGKVFNNLEDLESASRPIFNIRRNEIS